MFPPGRARLATKPDATGSPSLPMTMGIVTVASLAERVPAEPAVTMTSTLERASSTARVVTSFDLPSPNRYSMTIFFPSTYPSSRNPSRNASTRVATTDADAVPRKAIRGIFVGCWAAAILTHPKTKTRITTTPAHFRFCRLTLAPFTPYAPLSIAYYLMPFLFLFIQLLDKPALVQLCDKTRVDELFGFTIADFGSGLCDVVVSRL